METSTSIVKLAPALLAAQRTMSNAVKDAKNPFFKSKYADLNAIREACTPVLNANGISVLQPLIQKDGKTFVRTLLLHESGEFIAGDTEVVLAKQNDPQAQGSGISYARRYGLQSLVSLGAEDDDGEKAMARPTNSITAKVGQTTGDLSVTNEPAKELVKKSSFRKPVETKTEVTVPAISPVAQADGWEN